ncbi:receptor-like protein kinase FERONIA [Alnus glutinosa]|uniref:receptor-like protein kinase FERONIA n=1 Tax=Alnus glutinosa TaxID=3517 RepID=UPI002D779FD6|nr:receptor-like protein kinase FERONIA [Alnus glutinosa]
MYWLALYLSFLHLLLTQAVTGTQPPYAAIDYLLLDCGSSSNSTSLDGRNWDGDFNSKFSPPNIQTTSIASTPSQHDDPSVTQVPYMTARIFQHKFTYSFPVSPGLKFVRLYFFPATYSGLDKSKSFSFVTANNFTLLSNFSAFLTVSSLNPPVASFIKEFIIPVLYSQFLNITFIPSKSSYAFINGIEIISMPNNLYMYNRDYVITFVDYNSRSFYFDDTTALETMYRLNVGGKDVSGVEDTGMFRTWSQDSQYLFGQMIGLTPYRSKATIQYTTDTPAYTAPKNVYQTSRTMDFDPTVNLHSNLTWIFLVDGGFNYLLRLHFCETQLAVVETNQRVFYIFIKNQTAEVGADVIQWSGGTGIPVYREYVVLVPSGNNGKQDLWLALHPDLDMSPRPSFVSAILNGVEIFKLNQSDGSLAGLNPEAVAVPSCLEPKTKLTERTKWSLPFIAIIIGGAISVVAVVSILGLLAFRVSKRAKDVGSTGVASWWDLFPFTKTKSSKTRGSSLPSELCRNFSFAEIKAATNDFDNVLIIGVGGFGNVYKGYIYDGTTPVAIKRLKSGSKQGAHEFHTEIAMLSQLRYLHLVSLIGYCKDGDEMILVYDYMARGTLRDHLYNTDNPHLPWKQRLEICIGAARALNYLHTGAKQTIIHRDVKTTNILLDEKWVAKVSDFGLSKVGPISMSKPHVSTVVKGSFGYLDPEYCKRQQLTEKSDVYSFGVVLCEVVCGRPPIMRNAETAVGLARWARESYRNGKVEEMVDQSMKGEIGTRCLKKFVEIAMNCLLDNGIERPSMNDVVGGLEFALQLQESVDEDVGLDVAQTEIILGDEKALFPKSTLDYSADMSSSSSGQVSSRNYSNNRVTITSNGEQSFASASQDSGKLMSSGTEFSEIMNPSTSSR